MFPLSWLKNCRWRCMECPQLTTESLCENSMNSPCFLHVDHGMRRKPHNKSISTCEGARLHDPIAPDCTKKWDTKQASEWKEVRLPKPDEKRSFHLPLPLPPTISVGGSGLPLLPPSAALASHYLSGRLRPSAASAFRCPCLPLSQWEARHCPNPPCWHNYKQKDRKHCCAPYFFWFPSSKPMAFAAQLVLVICVCVSLYRHWLP